MLEIKTRLWNKIKRILRNIVPKKVLDFLGYSSNKGNLCWSGDFASWAEAAHQCSGYDPNRFLEKLIASNVEVEDGRAAYERDTVLFPSIEYSWPLLASLLFVYSKEGFINVLDFGGSLGTTWRQNRKFLNHISDLSWMVVEQEDIVAVGREKFEKKPLSFHSCLEDESLFKCNVVIFSGVLCYIEDAVSLVDRVTEINSIRFLVIDRTPFSDEPNDRITIQYVPAYIYSASYPCRLFSRERFLEIMEKDWNIIESWNCDEQPWPEAVFGGFLFERK